jgi:uncharacterized protein (DUF58 family)
MRDTAASLKQARAAEQAAGDLPALLVAAERLAQAIMLGQHGRRRAGPGDAFWQFRPYGFGDSTQRIDWRRSAKASRLFIRENEWEAANTLWLWVSASPRMDYASPLARETKRSRALLLALAMGFLALEGHERVGLLAGEPPVLARAGLPRLAAELLAAASEPLPPRARLSRASALVIAADFLDPLTAIEAALTPLAAQGVKGHLVQVTDPAEETLPFDGRTEFLGLDTPQRLLAGRAEALRAAYVEKFAAQRDGVQTIARRLGFTFTVHHTDRAPAATLLALHALIGQRLPPQAGGVA